MVGAPFSEAIWTFKVTGNEFRMFGRLKVSDV